MKSLNQILPIFVVFLILANSSVSAVSSKQREEAIRLNNEGVKALARSDFSLAIEKLSQAVKIYPKYSLSRKNLSIAHNKRGLQIFNGSRKQEALAEFHKAMHFDDANPTTRANIARLIKYLGKNPDTKDWKAGLYYVVIWAKKGKTTVPVSNRITILD